MIKIDSVSKSFNTGGGLSDLSISIEKGEFVFLVGQTGSGKTTLFRLLIRELVPSQGTIIVDEWDILRLPKNKIPNLRKKVGIVFQDLKLLLDRTIFENVVLPLEFAGVQVNEAKIIALEALSRVGLLDHQDKFPMQLSGGELQRVAIARALVLSPKILLADEPTGNLDPSTSNDIIKLLLDINSKGTTIVMATHNAEIVNKLAKRVITLEKGKMIKDEKKGKYGVS